MIGIALHHRQPAGNGTGDAFGIQFDATAIHLFFAAQIIEQQAIGTTHVKHGGTGRDMVRDLVQTRGKTHAAAPSPERRKPSTTAFIVGASSRKLSWPCGLESSTKLTWRPAATSACTMRRDSAVG